MDDHPETNLTCRDICDDLEMLVLGGLPSGRQLIIEDHLAVCQRCRRIEQDYRMILHEIKHSEPSKTSNAVLAESIRTAGLAEIKKQKSIGRRRRSLLAIGSAAAILLFGIIGFSLYRGGRSNAPGGKSKVAGVSPAAVEKWRYHDRLSQTDTPGELPVVRGEIFYSIQRSASESRIHAIDIQTGKLLWASNLRNIGFLAADDNHAFGLTRDESGRLSLIALDASAGRTAWRYEQGDISRFKAPYRPKPLANGTLSWIANRRLHILDSSTGKPIWVKSIPDAGALSDVLVNGTDLYVAGTGKLYCLDAKNGDERWTRELEQGSSGHSRPLIASSGRDIYIVRQRLGRPPHILCMSLATGQALWKKTVPSVPQSLLATEQGVFLRSSRILALDRRDGRRIWDYPSAGCGPMTVRRGQIHFVSAVEDGLVIALDQRTGEEAWRISGLRSCSSFTLIGDTGYIQTNDGAVRAISLAVR